MRRSPTAKPGPPSPPGPANRRRFDRQLAVEADLAMAFARVTPLILASPKIRRASARRQDILAIQDAGLIDASQAARLRFRAVNNFTLEEIVQVDRLDFRARLSELMDDGLSDSAALDRLVRLAAEDRPSFEERTRGFVREYLGGRPAAGPRAGKERVEKAPAANAVAEEPIPQNAGQPARSRLPTPAAVRNTSTPPASSNSEIRGFIRDYIAEHKPTASHPADADSEKELDGAAASSYAQPGAAASETQTAASPMYQADGSPASQASLPESPALAEMEERNLLDYAAASSPPSATPPTSQAASHPALPIPHSALRTQDIKVGAPPRPHFWKYLSPAELEAWQRQAAGGLDLQHSGEPNPGPAPETYGPAPIPDDP